MAGDRGRSRSQEWGVAFSKRKERKAEVGEKGRGVWEEEARRETHMERQRDNGH